MALLGLFENWPKFDVGEGAFYAVFGFLFVFAGIALLILFFTGLGLIMKKVNARPRKPKKVSGGTVASETVSIAPAGGEELSPELVAVITAAVAAYCADPESKCGFVVRRIKKL